MTNDFTPAQAARRLGISLDAVYKLIYAAKLAAKKNGNRWLVPAGAVDARVRAKKERGARDAGQNS